MGLDAVMDIIHGLAIVGVVGGIAGVLAAGVVGVLLLVRRASRRQPRD
ncbi:hypothetical protein [Leifsonia sp. LS1]|nr:hypothetical protein [Leifsonia sp. LS1]